MIPCACGTGFGALGKRCKVSYDLLMQINGIDNPRRLRAGQYIKLLKGPFHARVIKGRLEMYVYLQDVMVRRFTVGLGSAKNGTPTGQWLVDDRVRNPPYVDPDTGEYFAPNDPNNPVGGYWIRLRGLAGEAVGKSGYGIHGTTDPRSVGKYLSRGCVRMRREDIDLFYKMMYPRFSKVDIVP